MDDQSPTVNRTASIVLLASLATLPIAPDWLRNRVLSWIGGGAPVKDEPVARVIAASMDGYRMAVPQPAYPSDAVLRGLAVPTLALIAGRSKIHDSIKAHRRAQALVPGIEAEIWPNASHAIKGELAAEVNARVLRFVDEVDARP